MPLNPSPSAGALPARFRRQRLLIVGCGDIGLRVAALLPGGMRMLAVSSTPERAPQLRTRGITPLAGNLDRPETLRRLAGLADRILYLAPPPTQGSSDPRLRALLRVLPRRALPLSLVYGSTSGVYGDCSGEWVPETRAVAPVTPRAQRRADAEATLRLVARSSLGQRAMRASILRIPGIYAPDRAGGTPRERLLKGTPALRADDDVFTSHIHADDLARACIAALWRGRPQRVVNVNDDTELAMGDYFDLAADLYRLPRPPRISRAEAVASLTPSLLSFMSESRRLDNRRMKRELRLRLRYPTVREGLVPVPS